jgi:hypothetical protein
LPFHSVPILIPGEVNVFHLVGSLDFPPTILGKQRRLETSGVGSAKLAQV